jgi:hypothetical protein
LTIYLLLGFGFDNFKSHQYSLQFLSGFKVFGQ